MSDSALHHPQSTSRAMASPGGVYRSAHPARFSMFGVGGVISPEVHDRDWGAEVGQPTFVGHGRTQVCNRFEVEAAHKAEKLLAQAR